MNTIEPNQAMLESGHKTVDGMEMYYEIYGTGKPLVLIHGGGSTIQTSFGRVIPLLARTHRLICVELQAHGRTGDRTGPISFEQDADDVAELLRMLHVPRADIFGFSNGGSTALRIAIRHPQLCDKIIAGSPLLKREGAPAQFWSFMENGTFEQMPQTYKDAFLSVTPDQNKLLIMWRKCADRMIYLKDFTDEELRSIKSPVFLINGEADVATKEHLEAMAELIPVCKLAILPGGHGEYIGEINSLRDGYTSEDFAVSMIEEFLADG